MAAQMDGRIHFLDHLRGLIVVLVVLSHTLIPYMEHPLEWWYVTGDASRTLLHSILVTLNDAQLMPIMFFVAGFFIWPSLRRKGSAVFAREKGVRLGVPWLIGVTLCAPLSAYVARVSRQDPVGFLRFIAHDFWWFHFEQSVYWFLLLLLIFQLAAAGVSRLAPSSWQTPASAWHLSPGWVLAGLIALLAGAFFVLALQSPAWFGVTISEAPDRHVLLGGVLVVQTPRLPLYAAFFALGMHAWRHNWFRPNGYAPSLTPWLAGYLPALLAYLGCRGRVGGGSDLVHLAALAFIYTLFCATSLMAALALSRRFLNRETTFWHRLSIDSFGIYFMHPLAVYPLALLAREFQWHAWVKTLVIFLIAWGWSWLFTACVLKRAPLLRRIF